MKRIAMMLRTLGMDKSIVRLAQLVGPGVMIVQEWL
jgi:hypothetical protein